MTVAFIALGSNLGKKQKNCEEALAQLAQTPGIRLKAISRWHPTKAITLENETAPDFINGVVRIATTLAPDPLYFICKGIEKKMGRNAENSKKWSPRTIDLDILFYGDRVFESRYLKIPHPLLHERLFVLDPLCDIAPDFVHPILKSRVADLRKIMLGGKL